MSTTNSLRSEVAAWDGKSMDTIRRTYGRLADRRGFLESLVSLTSKVECQCGTTWLLKHHMEECGRPPSDGLVDEWYGLVNGLEHWASRLHVLQCMQYMSVPSRRVRQVERFVRAGLTDDTKLVRAWAYSGFYELAGKYPRYRKEAIALLEDAVTSDAAPSVRARVRRLLKQGFPRE